MSGSSGLLVDTGFFVALYDERDRHHSSARKKRELLDVWPVVLPWPVLYETVSTRFSKRPGNLTRFNAIVAKPDTVRLDDGPYREKSYTSALTWANNRRHLSLVDCVLRAIVEDPNVRIEAMLTFNPGDFHDVCRECRVELP